MEQGIDKPRCHTDKLGQFRLEQIVVMLILSTRKLEILFDLEQVLFITQRLLLLFPQLVQGVVVSVKVDQFVISLDAGLADLFADFGQFLARSDDPGFNKLELGCEGIYKISKSKQERKGTRKQVVSERKTYPVAPPLLVGKLQYSVR